MKIYFKDQRENFEEHLDQLSREPVMIYDRNQLTENISRILIQTDKVDFKVLFDYRVFPNHIMNNLTEWKIKNRQMQVGDTIVQQIHIPPVQKFSQKIILGVRICEIVDEPNTRGFSYETLAGHVEKGISTFIISHSEGIATFEIKTYSELGNRITRLLGPIFAIPYQKYCTNQALLNVKRQLENGN